MAVTTNLAAQPIAFEEAKPYLGIFEQFVTIPGGYQFHSVKKVKVDDESLANNLKNLWVDRHDEEISINNGEKTIIAGMKYKCYRSPGNDYAWVIVGFDGSVITFERNIKWNTSEHKRITGKWLHDNWLNEQTI